MEWLWMADAVLLVHAAYAAYVVFGLALILIGKALGARWVRNLWFRITHLAAIGLVAAESIAGVACPLTVLENRLRLTAGERGYASAGCVARWIQPLLFFDFPLWVFSLIYIVFAVLTGALLIAIPPRFSAPDNGLGIGASFTSRAPRPSILRRRA